MRHLYLFLLFSAYLSAAEKYAIYESAHFELITDGSKGRAQDLLAHFERVRSFFVKTLATQDPLVKPRIVAIQSEKEYKLYAPSEVAAAYYTPLLQRDLIVIGPLTSQRVRQVAVHEYLHLLIRQMEKPVPVWMNEGIAELYSNIEQTKGVVRVGTPIPERIFELRASWLPLAEVVQVGRESPLYNRRQHAGTFYGMSWALVHMLFLDPKYRPGFQKMFDEISGGGDPIEVFQKVYGKPVTEIDADLGTYVRGNAFFVQNHRTQFDAVDEKVAPRPATAYDWGVALAEVSLALHRDSVAEQRLEELVQSEPTRPEAWESLAFVRGRLEKASSAEAFQKALGAGSTQPNLLYWAPLLARNPADVRSALALLVKSHPNFVGGHIRMAQTLLRQREYAAAHDAIRTVRRISPRDVHEYFPVYVQALWFARDVEEARKAADQYSRLALRPADKERARLIQEFAKQNPPPANVQMVVTAAPVSESRLEFDEDAVPELPTPKLVTHKVTGTLIHLRCEEPAILTIRTGAAEVKLRIDSPTALQVKNTEDGKGELPCGDQSRKVALEYLPRPDLPDGLAGLARSIEFLP